MTMHYYLKDHEGNVRVVTDGDGKVEQVNHYYPFGGPAGRERPRHQPVCVLPGQSCEVCG